MDAAKEEWWYESDVVTKYKFERNIPAVPKIACAGVRSLTPEESEQLNQVVEEAKRLEPSGYGKTHLLEHKIRLTNETPIRQKPYNFNPKMQEIVDQEVEKMLEMDVIQPSRSDWCNPLIMVKKPDGSYRCVLDFRKLNAVTERDLSTHHIFWCDVKECCPAFLLSCLHREFCPSVEYTGHISLVVVKR
ncbi:hypothetical protein M8J75_015665 [Diaphorina citri]|nr:hypothetical protein M8J75_015665 [Diaphorina citri]